MSGKSSLRNSLWRLLLTVCDRRWRVAAVVGVICVVAIGAVVATLRTSRPRLAFVRSDDLVYGYVGMEEARNRYRARQVLWQREADSLRNFTQHSADSLRRYVADPVASVRTRVQAELGKVEEHFDKRMQVLEQSARQEENELTSGVLRQVHEFVRSYAKEHGYSLVLGSTSDAPVFYGDEALDITEEILRSLNREYQN